MRILSTLCLFVLSLVTSFFSHAEDRTPPVINLENNKLVFSDFQHARYILTYDISKKVATVETHIYFHQAEDGQPAFDALFAIDSAELDGQPVAFDKIGVPAVSKKGPIYFSKVSVAAGEHIWKIRSRLSENVLFRPQTVSSSFMMSDLKEPGRYLSTYVPGNLEYDHYAMEFEVTVVGGDPTLQDVLANGDVQKVSDNQWKVTFPEYFTGSSVFFHLLEKNSFDFINTSLVSMDGRTLPVTIFNKKSLLGPSTEIYRKATFETIAYLESKWGPFPHSKIVIYGTGALRGGMEYCGATVSNLESLEHELTHSYYARGVMPYNGNAGWIDEAIAMWFAKPHDGVPDLLDAMPFSRSFLISGSIYNRLTNDDAYQKGGRLIAHINSLTGDKLFGMLVDFKNKNLFQSVTSEDFRLFLEGASGISLKELFDRYVYNGKGPEGTALESGTESGSGTGSESESGGHAPRGNQFHPILTDEEMKELL